MKKMLKESKPKFNIDFVPDFEPNTKPKIKQRTIQETIDSQSSFDTLDIHIIKTISLTRLAKKPKYIIFTVTMADIKKALAPKKHTNFATKVPVKHHKHLNAFL